MVLSPVAFAPKRILTLQAVWSLNQNIQPLIAIFKLHSSYRFRLHIPVKRKPASNFLPAGSVFAGCYPNSIRREFWYSR
jgi:hypothetical protein|tara:strand:- start:262 stop:498 length:237 start_codon:yes stop_codon:yes gene_type:complete